MLELLLDEAAREEGRQLFRGAVSESGYPAGHKERVQLSPPARSRIVEWVRKITSGYTYELKDTLTATIDLPLFTLHSPKTPGSRVTYEDSQARGQEKGWRISIFGLGFGATQEMSVTYKIKIMSTGGGCKLIFVPGIPVRVTVKKVFKNGNPIGELYSAEVYGISQDMLFEKGVRACPAEACRESSCPEDKCESFLLAGGTLGDIATYVRQWTRGDDCEIPLAINVGPVNLTMKAAVRLEQEVTLTYELPEGHDYRLRYFARKHGIAWEVA